MALNQACSKSAFEAKEEHGNACRVKSKPRLRSQSPNGTQRNQMQQDKSNSGDPSETSDLNITKPVEHCNVKDLNPLGKTQKEVFKEKKKSFVGKNSAKQTSSHESIDKDLLETALMIKKVMKQDKIKKIVEKYDEEKLKKILARYETPPPPPPTPTATTENIVLTCDRLTPMNKEQPQYYLLEANNDTLSKSLGNIKGLHVDKSSPIKIYSAITTTNKVNPTSNEKEEQEDCTQGISQLSGRIFPVSVYSCQTNYGRADYNRARTPSPKQYVPRREPAYVTRPGGRDHAYGRHDQTRGSLAQNTERMRYETSKACDTSGGVCPFQPPTRTQGTYYALETTGTQTALPTPELETTKDESREKLSNESQSQKGRGTNELQVNKSTMTCSLKTRMVLASAHGMPNKVGMKTSVESQERTKSAFEKGKQYKPSEQKSKVRNWIEEEARKWNTNVSPTNREEFEKLKQESEIPSQPDNNIERKSIAITVPKTYFVTEVDANQYAKEGKQKELKEPLEISEESKTTPCEREGENIEKGKTILIPKSNHKEQEKLTPSTIQKKDEVEQLKQKKSFGKRSVRSKSGSRRMKSGFVTSEESDSNDQAIRKKNSKEICNLKNEFKTEGDTIQQEMFSKITETPTREYDKESHPNVKAGQDSSTMTTNSIMKVSKWLKPNDSNVSRGFELRANTKRIPVRPSTTENDNKLPVYYNETASKPLMGPILQEQKFLEKNMEGLVHETTPKSGGEQNKECLPETSVETKHISTSINNEQKDEGHQKCTTKTQILTVIKKDFCKTHADPDDSSKDSSRKISSADSRRQNVHHWSSRKHKIVSAKDDVETKSYSAANSKTDEDEKNVNITIKNEDGNNTQQTGREDRNALVEEKVKKSFKVVDGTESDISSDDSEENRASEEESDGEKQITVTEKQKAGKKMDSKHLVRSRRSIKKM